VALGAEPVEVPLWEKAGRTIKTSDEYRNLAFRKKLSFIFFCFIVGL